MDHVVRQRIQCLRAVEREVGDLVADFNQQLAVGKGGLHVRVT